MPKFLTSPERAPILKSNNAFVRGFDEGRSGMLWSMPLAALEIATAQRGEMSPTLAGKVGGMVSFPLVSAAISTGLAMIPGIGLGTAAFMSMILGMYPNNAIENGITRAVRGLTDAGRAVRHLEFGGNYTDTTTAFQQRQIAAQAIGSAMPAARRQLGQEALFFHR